MLDSNKEACGIGTYLAQGAAGNVIATFLLFLVLWLISTEHYAVTTLIFLSIYLLIVGFVGAVVGGLLWILVFLLGRRLGILARASIGVFVSFLIPAFLILALESEFLLDWFYASIPLLFLLLPAALMSGSRFPLRAAGAGSHRMLPVTMLEIRMRHALNYW